MKFARRRLLQLAAGAIAAPALARSAFAQAYPSKPITIVAPFAAGGATDTIARVMAEGMRKPLGQTVIVENATGAGGTIGAGRVARAAPDGYTLSVGQNGSHVITGATYSKLSFHVMDDFEPITPLCVAPFAVVGKKALPPNDMKELISWLKANPGKATIGNAGVGSITHVCGLLFEQAVGTKLQHVPYRGIAPSIQDLLAGNIDLVIADPITSIPQARGNNIKMYGITAAARLQTAPEYPTVDQAGLPGFHVSLWHGMWAPKGTPKDVVGKLNAAAREALAEPAVRTRLAGLSQEIFARDRQTPEALRAMQKADIDKWWPIIKAGNIKVD
ncbi:MAG: tripartite tricarboxylate transporter substrate binding protein BugD [Alphaproteobacteria bacterium]|nr:tripartite tricarboxylate transporter substrate binding protein BugD [Alphaproteobacteria bacterium]